MNNSAFLYCQSHFDTIQNICFPLKNYLGIENFGYLKIFKDSQYFYISNDLNLAKDYLFNVESSNIFFKECLNDNGSSKNTYFILWPETPQNFSMDLYLKHNYWNGLTILKINNDDIEMWWFASKLEHNTLQSFYKKNIDVLLNFINYFNYETHDIIQPKKHNLAYYSSGFDFNFAYKTEDFCNESKNIEAFLNHLYPNGIYITSKNGIIKLTHREINCLQLLAKCYSAKEIAKELNITNRTVETHLEHIRRKSGYSLKSDIIKVFYDQIENLLPRIHNSN